MSLLVITLLALALAGCVNQENLEARKEYCNQLLPPGIELTSQEERERVTQCEVYKIKSCLRFAARVP